MMSFRYKAFISYRHVARDRKWAKWLLNQLETYRVPKHLVNQGIPKQLGKLFRDDDEIPASANLSQQIQTALIESEYLIVICSPDTPLSSWVQKEIETFKSLGREENIIALLVEGEPAESFPKSLRYKFSSTQKDDGTTSELMEEVEPLAADVRFRDDEKQSLTKRRALLRVVATLLKCRFDDLMQRDQERKKVIRRLVLQFIAILVGVTVFFYWDYNRVKTKYFVDYGQKWLIPYGINEVSKEQAEKRQLSYMFIYKRNKLVELSPRQNVKFAINQQAPSPFNFSDYLKELNKFSHIRLFYNDDGSINTLEYSDKNNLYRQIIEMSADKKSAFVAIKQGRKGETRLINSFNVESDLGAKNETSFTFAGISNAIISFDSEGFIKTFEFVNSDGEPSANTTGSYGVNYRYNSNGQVIKFHQFGSDDNQMINNHIGCAITKIDYDSNGNKTEIHCLDNNGHPQSGLHFWSSIRIEYNNEGNPILKTSLDIDKKLVFNDKGIAFERYSYDAFGNVIAKYNLDLNKNLISKTNKISLVKAIYDEHHNQVELSFFGADGKPKVFDSFGSATTKNTFDERGNRILEESFGANGERVLNSEGFSVMNCQYHYYKNEIKHLTIEPTTCSFYDTLEKPVISKFGYAAFIDVLDYDGNVIKEAYIPNNKQGCHYLLYEHDLKLKQIISTTCLGDDEKPINNIDGYSKIKYIYKKGSGRLFRLDYLGVNNRPALYQNKYTTEKYNYDKFGNLDKTEYYDIEGRLVDIEN